MMRWILLVVFCSGCFAMDAWRFPLEPEVVEDVIEPCTECPDVEWVEIPGGTFWMGDDSDPSTSPRHQVTVPTFWITAVEVTVASYRACRRAQRPDGDEVCWPSGTGEKCTYGMGNGQLPINCVDHQRAVQFATWLGGRLPSEAEWEYAASSAGLVQKFPWGDEAPDCTRAVLKGCGNERPSPVCTRPDGVTEDDLCDMVGNVAEWLADDWHPNYVGAPTDGSPWLTPFNPDERYATTPPAAKVVRGGSYTSDQPSSLRLPRFAAWPYKTFIDVGFRVVRETPP